MSENSSDSSVRFGGLGSGFDTQSIIDKILIRDKQDIKKLEDKRDINAAKIEIWSDIQTRLEDLSDKVSALKHDATNNFNLLKNYVATTTNTTNTNQTGVTASVTNASATQAGNIALNITQPAKPMIAYGAIQAANYTNPIAGNFYLNGAQIPLGGGEALQDIAKAINGAGYATNQAVSARVIDNRLVLTAQSTGAAYKIYGSTDTNPPFNVGTDDPDNILTSLGIIDGTGNFTSSISAQDASLTIDGVSTTSSSNTITAISGVTIHIDPNAVTFPANIGVNIGYDTKAIQSAITDLVSSYNETREYLNDVRNNAKLDPKDKNSIFATDALLRGLYNDIRSMMTQGVTMGTVDWTAASGTTTATGTVGNQIITINNLKYNAGDGKLREGDRFSIAGDLNSSTGLPNVYTVIADTNISTASPGSASVSIYPALATTVAAATVNLETSNLSSIGIDVAKDRGAQKSGTLVINTQVLQDAIQTNMPLVQRILARTDPIQPQNNGTNTTNDRSYDPSRLGVVERLYSMLDKHIQLSVTFNIKRSIRDIRIPTIRDDIKRQEGRIQTLQTRMAKKEMVLIKKFAEMENAMSRSNSAKESLQGLQAPGG